MRRSRSYAWCLRDKTTVAGFKMGCAPDRDDADFLQIPSRLDLARRINLAK
jgi:hypothetical protein